MAYNLHFSLQNAVSFHNSNVFGSCIIQILYTGCAKIKKRFRRQKLKALNQQYKFCVAPNRFKRSLNNFLMNIPDNLIDASLRPKFLLHFLSPFLQTPRYVLEISHNRFFLFILNPSFPIISRYVKRNFNK